MNRTSKSRESVEKSMKTIKEAFSIDGEEQKFNIFNENSDDYRFTQEDVMRSILKGNDTFAIIQTGGGKSFCFQGPAICFSGITIVITPLVALIDDQVNKFNESMEKAFIEGRTKKKYKAACPTREMFDELIKPKDEDTEYKLLYLSPERISMPKFSRRIRELESDGHIVISHIVVDEVHCLSQWGFDFRESYLRILKFIKERPKRPVISAFTATATPQDIEYIKNLLEFDKREKAGKYYHFFCMETRNNLNFRIVKCNDGSNSIKKPSRYDKLLELLALYKDAKGIIYCTTIKQVDNLYEKLSNAPDIQNKKLCKYHAQLSETKRSVEAKAFADNPGSIMIATKAFGMGISIKKIELIIHYDIPACLEEYYQETGRAGRRNRDEKDDVKEGHCYLLYSEGIPKNGELPEHGSLSWTKKWIDKDTDRFLEMKTKSIQSQLSKKEKQAIVYLAKYRFCKVMEYCELVSDDNSDLQSYITEYLKEEIRGDAFKIVKDKKMKIDQEFINNIEQNRDDFIDKFIKDLKKIITGVYELHINNTKIANIIRWHPDSYQLNTANNIDITEWKRKNRKESREKIFSTDIRYDTYFVRSSDPEDPDLINKINELWIRYDRKIQEDQRVLEQSLRYPKHPMYLFVVNSIDKTLARIFSYSYPEGMWTKCDAADRKTHSLINEFINKEASIEGLFARSRYGLWWDKTIEDYFTKFKTKDTNTDANAAFAYVKGVRSRAVTFTLTGDEKPSYFDMCVADAVYSIGMSGANIIYVNKIWQVLTGDPDIKFSRADSFIKTEIEKSLEKLMKLKVSIQDKHHYIDIPESVFLPIMKRPKGELGYYYLDTPPLYRYAEKINGELIRIPISLMSVGKGNDNKSKKHKKKPTNKPCKWNATIENAVIIHYLLHRVSISRRKKRGKYLSILSIREILDKNLRESRKDYDCLCRKIIGILIYYKDLKYLNFQGYCRDYNIIGTEIADIVESDINDPYHLSESIIAYDNKRYSLISDKTNRPIKITMLDGILLT